MGKIFLGLGAIRHLLVWSAIILFNVATEVSAFAILLVFWPVADTVLAIWRRWRLACLLIDRISFTFISGYAIAEIKFLGFTKEKLAIL